MSNTIWALATAGFAPLHVHAFDTSLVPAARRRTREGADAGADPVTECFAAVASEAMRRPHEFKDQELKDVLWSFSKVRGTGVGRADPCAVAAAMYSTDAARARCCLDRAV